MTIVNIYYTGIYVLYAGYFRYQLLQFANLLLIMCLFLAVDLGVYSAFNHCGMSAVKIVTVKVILTGNNSACVGIDIGYNWGLLTSIQLAIFLWQ